jgi:CubicO group peptidase (beta-lactamase class C family)
VHADYVTRNILRPLGLQSTAPGMPSTERGKWLVTGYGVLNREGRRQPLAFFTGRGITPAAGFSSTAEVDREV